MALCAIVDSPRLSETARRLIQNPHATIWVSSVSVWEIAIKHSLGRSDIPISGNQAFSYFREAGYRFLAIAPEHVAAVETLPHHHSDPFDRLLIAQAQVEPMRLVSHDSQIARYGDLILFV